MAEEAEAARAGEGAAEQRATAAEARAGEIERDARGLEFALRAERRRGLAVEGEAADMRDVVAVAVDGAVGGGGVGVEDMRERIEELERRLEASESARLVCV